MTAPTAICSSAHSDARAARGDALRNEAENNATVQAILKTFPGARLDAVRRKGDAASLVAGLEGTADDGAPLPEEYPADDDIPESDY